jgi:hypothetical protein
VVGSELYLRVTLFRSAELEKNSEQIKMYFYHRLGPSSEEYSCDYWLAGVFLSSAKTAIESGFPLAFLPISSFQVYSPYFRRLFLGDLPMIEVQMTLDLFLGELKVGL